MAGALGIALAGPRQYGDITINDAWMNNGGRKNVTSSDIHRALALYQRTGAGLAALLLLAMTFA